MSDIKFNNGYTYGVNGDIEEPLKIDFSKIIVPDEGATNTTSNPNLSIADAISEGKVNFGSVSVAYKNEGTPTTTTTSETPKFYNDAHSNVTYLNTNPTFNVESPAKEVKGAGNVFATTQPTSKASSTELQRIVQKLDKLEKMINPNSKKSLILWEEDNSFKNIISGIVSYSTTCDTEAEFPIELYDRMKALGEDVSKQLAEGAEKIVELEKQQKANTVLSEILSNAYVSATAGLPREEYEANLVDPDIACYKEQLATIATCAPDSEEYVNAEKTVKSKITNLENSVHITIDLERTTSKDSALKYIQKEITPAIERLQAAYDKQYAASVATTIDSDEAITALVVKKSLTERIYDTFVRPFANLFRRKNKAK